MKKEPLALTITTSKTALKNSDDLSFTVCFQNQSTNDLLLNGGELLGNGAQLWSGLEVELKTENGQRLPIALGWGIPGVAGRIYFLGLPLRAGSSYKLPVNPNDYFIGTTGRLKPGKYEIRFVYHGRQSSARDSTQMPACWEGELNSNTLRFEVLAD